MSLGELMAPKLGSINPSKFPDEVFDLYSIPAFDIGESTLVSGADVGSTKQIVAAGDVLLSKIVPHIRRAWVVGPDRGKRIVASGEWIVFRHSGIDSRYLRHALVTDSFHAHFMATVAGVGGSLLRARPAQVANISIAMPPLAEQRRIADILDRADALRAKRRAALATLESLAQAVFVDMFGDLAANPKNWPIVPLSDAVQCGTSVTYGIVQAGDEVPGGVPYIRTGDLVNGEIVVDGLRRTAPEIASRFARSRVESGDIVMSIRATVGTTAMVPPTLDGANLTQGTARIAPSDSVRGPYLLHMLRTPRTQGWIQRQVKGATFREITLARLRELPVVKAPVDLQDDFAARISAVEQTKRNQGRALAYLDELFASLQQRAFRGEL